MIICEEIYFEENVFDFTFNMNTADGLAPLDSRISEGTVVIRFMSCIWLGMVFEV